MGLAARSNSTVRVHLASQDVLTIAGLRQLLKPCAFISVCGVTSDDEATLAAVTASNPDVLVVSGTDEHEIEALAAAARIVSQTTKVVVLADEALAHQLIMEDLIRLEAVLVRGGDYLEDIGAVLRIVHRGGHVTTGHSALKAAASDRRPIDPKRASRLLTLSARELQIMREVAAGRTNAQIAQPLHVSVATIKADLARIMEVMQAASRVDLAVQAVQCGLVDDEPDAIVDRILLQIKAEDEPI